VGAAAGAARLVAAVGAGHRPGHAGVDAVLADARVTGARLARGARDARTGAVADHVRAAAGAGRLVAAVDAGLRSCRARRRAVLADARVGGAGAAGGAGDAHAGAVADHVRAAVGAGRRVAAVDAGHRARRAGGHARLAGGRVAAARLAGGAGDARARAVADHVGTAADARRLGATVAAGHRARRAGRRPVDADVRVTRARRAGGARHAAAGSVADHVGAAARSGGLRAAVHAHRRAGRARRDAVVADRGARRARDDAVLARRRIAAAAGPRRARDAAAGAVADHVGAAAGPRGLVR